MGITGLGMVRAIPTAALGNSIGFVIVDIFYLVMLMRARTAGSSKAAVLISTVLLCLRGTVLPLDGWILGETH